MQYRLIGCKEIFIILISALSLFSQTWEDDTLAVRAILDSSNLTLDPVSIFVTGTTLDGKKRVGSFTLVSGNAALRKMPAEIGKLTALKTIELWRCRIITLPPEIGNCVNLESIYMVECLLTRLPPEISNLTKLTHIELTQNNLKTLPNEIGDCTQILSLRIDYNHITGLPHTIINLQRDGLRVYVDGNHLMGQPWPIVQWLDKYAGETWEQGQIPAAILSQSTMHNSPLFTLFQSSGSSANLILNLPAPGHVRVDLIDPAGRTVNTVINRYMQKGTCNTSVNIGSFGAGTWFLRLRAGENNATRRIVLVK